MGVSTPLIDRDALAASAESVEPLPHTVVRLATLVADPNSDIREIKACMTGPETAWAGMKFSRLKADGEPLPPKDRASAYELKKFDDGWRITKLTGGDAAKPLACPAG